MAWWGDLARRFFFLHGGSISGFDLPHVPPDFGFPEPRVSQQPVVVLGALTQGDGQPVQAVRVEPQENLDGQPRVPLYQVPEKSLLGVGGKVGSRFLVHPEH